MAILSAAGRAWGVAIWACSAGGAMGSWWMDTVPLWKQTAGTTAILPGRPISPPLRAQGGSIAERPAWLGHGIEWATCRHIAGGRPAPKHTPAGEACAGGPKEAQERGSGGARSYIMTMNTNKIALQTNNGPSVQKTVVAAILWLIEIEFLHETFRRIDLGNNAVALQAANGRTSVQKTVVACL